MVGLPPPPVTHSTTKRQKLTIVQGAMLVVKSEDIDVVTGKAASRSLGPYGLDPRPRPDDETMEADAC